MAIIKHKKSDISQQTKQLFANAGNRARQMLVVAMLAMTVLLPSGKAYATCGACTDCTLWQNYIKEEMDRHKNWMITEWWDKNLKPAMQSYTDNIRGAFITDAVAIGAFLDGESAMNAQRTVQELNANTIKSYNVSDSICKFGTLSRSLAVSQERAKANQIVLAERSQDRQLGKTNMAAEKGSQEDRNQRYKQFLSTFCDPMDYGSAMSRICTTPPPDKSRNLDVNYTRLIDANRTLNIDFAGGAKSAASDDEKAVIAMANNLYANQVLERMPSGGLRDTNAVDNRSTYLDQRSVVAKRSVAENSFNAIVGQKAAGGAVSGGVSSKAYMMAVLKKLGLPDVDTDKYLGDKPSYDAQMEVLTKKLYQDPSFYANLYNSPANVERQYAALQSFGLMQRRDIFETLLRSEMLMSMILEMELTKYQDDVQNQQNK